MKRGKEEEEKEPFQDKGPFTPLWERLLLAKDVIHVECTDLDYNVDEELDKIKDGLRQISTAFLALEEWKKDVVDQLEKLIRDTNKRNPCERRLFPITADKIKQICDQVANFLPQVFESWKNAKRGVEEVKEEYWDFDLNITAPEEIYEGMDDQIKQCFRCLSLFPENSIVRKRDLIYWWIGEGFVQPSGAKTADEVGEECFLKLLEYHDLINPFFNKGSNRIIGLTLHPCIRSFAVSAADKYCFFFFDSQGKPTTFNPFRACISGTEKIDIFPSPNMVNLVSIFNVDVLYLNFEKGVANDMNNLTVLQLGRWRSFPKHNNKAVNLTNFLECLPLLKSLRYLGLQDTYGICELPDKISNLSSLTVLDLRGCHDLERLPYTISELKSLTHLDVSDCEVLQSLPFEVRNLELLVMKGLVIGNSISKTSLTNLKQWDKLRKLSINFGNKVEIDEVELGGVKHLRSLTTLIITWWVKNRNQLKTSTWNMDWLPECLEKLDLHCFPLEKLPSGLVPTKLKNLKRLYLRGGKLQSLEGLEVEGQKWQVEILRLRYLIELKEDLFSLSRVFPGLKYLEIEKCTNIEPFPADKWVFGGLDKQLKSCLLYFSIFPKNFIVSCESFIYRRNLIYWWIGEGFVEPTGDKTAEQVGEDCFFKLIERGLIEPFPKMSTGIVGACKISPSIHYQVVCLARGSQFFAFPDRKCLTKSSNPFESVSFSLTDELGCVINLNAPILCFNNDATNTLKNLTVLDLGDWSTSSGHVDWLGMRAGDGVTIENLDSFFKCLHLLKRLIYLGLAGVSGIKEIPDTISELSELRVLNLHSCYDLKRLSNEVVQLRKLTHLNMSGSSLRHIPMKLNDLEELQVVKGFKFTDSKDVNQGDLSNLDKWKNLRKLSITFLDPQGTNESALGGVKHLLSLRSLSIDFYCSIDNGSAVHLHWLPPNLEKLELIGGELEELRPQVVQSLSNLKRLYLQDCGFRSLKVFEETSSGLNVQVLRLMELFHLKLDWSEVRHIFPCLKYAYVHCCPDLTSFRGDKYGVWGKDDRECEIDTEGCLHDNEAAERRAIRAAKRHAAERDVMRATERDAMWAEERRALKRRAADREALKSAEATWAAITEKRRRALKRREAERDPRLMY